MQIPQKKIKIVYWDVETIQNIVAIFQLTKNYYIDPSNILTEAYMLCASWKIDGEDKVHAVSVLDDPKRFTKNPADDYHVIKTLHTVLSDADCIVHHRGDAFDKPWLDARILYHGLDPLPPITSIDTYKVVKNRFRLNSNKLDYLGKYLGVGQKLKTSPGLWIRVIKGDKTAIREMVAYNKVDVEVLEKVFKKIQPYVQNHINRQLFGATGCPRCGSKKVQSRGTYYAQTRTYRRFVCTSCRGWFRALKTDKGSGTPSRVV